MKQNLQQNNHFLSPLLIRSKTKPQFDESLFLRNFWGGGGVPRKRVHTGTASFGREGGRGGEEKGRRGEGEGECSVNHW